MRLNPYTGEYTERVTHAAWTGWMASVKAHEVISTEACIADSERRLRAALEVAVVAEREACISVALNLDVESFGITPERAVQVIVAYQEEMRKRSNASWPDEVAWLGHYTLEPIEVDNNG